MRFVSTRGQTPDASFSEAVATGLAPDGGLFLPQELPDLSAHLRDWEQLSYPELATAFFRHFATDIEPPILENLVERSYGKFTHPEIAPVVTLGDGLYVLELFHGPTLAFKDFALQLLGNLYEYQIKKTGRPINVLGATSGDTGSAAIHGLLGKDGVNVFILYPRGRTSPLQERQMTCTGAENVFPLAIEGTFDDAQTALKEVFADQDFRVRYGLSAVNSINIARVLAQSVYYLYAWFRLPEVDRATAEFVVPTGNFGNVLAGWMLRRMGVPIGGFCVATNQNDILYRFFQTGAYEVSRVAPSLAPSMDIQVASNFERFLFYALEGDSAKVRETMAAFKAEGRVEIGRLDGHGFRSSRMEDVAITENIEDVYDTFQYVVDPHTACAFADLREDRPEVVLATAHPAKFPDTIEEAIGQHPTHPSLEELKKREPVNYPVDPTPEAIQRFIADKAIIQETRPTGAN